MAVNKVVLGEDTLIDLTGDTVSADKLSKGITAHNMAGEPIVGTMEAGGGVPDNMVTTDTNQTITGTKTFSNIRLNSSITSGISDFSGNKILLVRTDLNPKKVDVGYNGHDLQLNSKHPVIVYDGNHIKTLATTDQIPTVEANPENPTQTLSSIKIGDVDYSVGGGGGSGYTFTDGLTETNGTVSWDLNDRIKAGSGNYTIILGEPNSNTISSGTDNIIKGYQKVTGSNNIVLGWNNTVSGESNFINGSGNSVQTRNNFVFSDSNSLKTGTFNFIAGGNFNSARNNCNIILGERCDCDGSCSLAVGGYVNSRGAYQIVAGKYNINDSGSGWSLGNFSFIVGNGTSNDSRSNAYTLDWQGNGTFSGTVSSSTGADYAEYFEWKDGNPNNEDRVGYIVTLDGDKIVKANNGDDVLGICSGTAMVLGDSAEWNWSKRYLTDDFGRIIYEDYDVEHEEIKDEETGKVIEEAWTEHIHAPKTNPEYDASQPYVKRADRPEWQIVGMMGKIYVRDDGTCVVNGYANVKDGIATKANGKTNMRVMERVTDNIVRVLMK